ncbi:hypothetical protein Hpoki52_02520 [Helicobacter pylori]
MAKEILVAYGVDIDAVAGWLGSYGGEEWVHMGIRMKTLSL